MAVLLIKKRKEEFFKKFQTCQLLMISLENDIIDYRRDDFPNNLKRLFITANKNYKIEMRRIFQHQAMLNLEPNYIMLNGIHDLLIDEITYMHNRISTDNSVEKGIQIYNSRMDMCGEMLFRAGTKDLDDIYSQTDGSEDWELIRYYTEEIIPNTEEKTKKSWEKFSKIMKSMFVAVVKDANMIPDSNKDIKNFVKVHTEKILSNNEEATRIITASQEKVKKSQWNFGIFSNFLKSTTMQNQQEISDEFSLLIATPDFRTLRILYNLTDIELTQTFMKLFVIDGIKTNIEIYIQPDIMKKILRKDPVHGDNRPMVPIETGDDKLKMEYTDIIHKNIIQKFPDSVRIRFISHRNLGSIKENFYSVSHRSKNSEFDDLEKVDEVEGSHKERFNKYYEKIDIKSKEKTKKNIVDYGDKIFSKEEEKSKDSKKNNLTFSASELLVKMGISPSKSQSANLKNPVVEYKIDEKNIGKKDIQKKLQHPENIKEKKPENQIEEVTAPAWVDLQDAYVNKWAHSKRNFQDQTQMPAPILPISSKLQSDTVEKPKVAVIDHYLEKNQPVKVSRDKFLKVRNSPKHLSWKKEEHVKYFQTVMVHLHGGGFVGMSSKSHLSYQIPWAKELKVPIFSIDYRLAPEVQYPFMLNDVINAYLWIIYFIETILKIKINNQILTGDSAGGTLSLALVNWCIVNNIRKPDFVFPHYPAAMQDIGKDYSPSYQFSMNDPFQNYSSLRMFIKYYVPSHLNALEDCYISPLCTPDWILENYPEISIGICEYDPLRDDAFRFAHRLLLVQKEAWIFYCRFLSHGVLNLAIKQGVPEAYAYLNKTIEIFRKVIKNSKEKFKKKSQYTNFQ